MQGRSSPCKNSAAYVSTMPGGGAPKLRHENHSAMHLRAGTTRFAGLLKEELNKKSNRTALISLMLHYGVFVTQVWPEIERVLQARTANIMSPLPLPQIFTRTQSAAVPYTCHVQCRVRTTTLIKRLSPSQASWKSQVKT